MEQQNVNFYEYMLSRNLKNDVLFYKHSYIDQYE